MKLLFDLQLNLFETFPKHRFSQELEIISDWLEAHDFLVEDVAKDLRSRVVQATGRRGITVESILRAAVIRQRFDISYEHLAFLMADSDTVRAFCRLDGKTPSASTLQAHISRIKASTWEDLSRCLLQSALEEGLEDVAQTRVDSTVVATDIHEPTDSSLLYDGIHSLVRLFKSLQQVKEMPVLCFSNHQRAAKKRAKKLAYQRRRIKATEVYRELIQLASTTVGYADIVLSQVPNRLKRKGVARGIMVEIDNLASLTRKVIDQTRRRVLEGEQVPAEDKVFSLFETHTDIIVKGGRDIQYGHKINLSTGKNGFILNMMVDRGNPADSAKAVEMVEAHVETFGRPPQSVSFDGGYASQGNLKAIKKMGAINVVFHKKCQLKEEDMAEDKRTYVRLKKFRAGIEGVISNLKRVYGWARCKWKGWNGFQRYVWLSAATFNLIKYARAKLQTA